MVGLGASIRWTLGDIEPLNKVAKRAKKKVKNGSLLRVPLVLPRRVLAGLGFWGSFGGRLGVGTSPSVSVHRGYACIPFFGGGGAFFVGFYLLPCWGDIEFVRFYSLYRQQGPSYSIVRVYSSHKDTGHSTNLRN